MRSGDSPRLAAALIAESLKPTKSDEHTLLVPGATSARVGDIAFAAGVAVHELATEGSSLEEIFLQLTSDEQS